MYTYICISLSLSTHIYIYIYVHMNPHGSSPSDNAIMNCGPVYLSAYYIMHTYIHDDVQCYNMPIPQNMYEYEYAINIR